MNKLDDYGVVYTPKGLAKFMAQITYDICKKNKLYVDVVLDPACGESMLLFEFQNIQKDGKYIGIDVDKCVIRENKKKAVSNFVFINNDTICPRNVKQITAYYWKKKLGKVSLILANPPWSGEKIYDNELLQKKGFLLAEGQYDSYVLFIELSLQLLCENGVMAFIIPDSLFASQNIELRKMLYNYTHIEVVARLGEKLFKGVNRATTVIVCRKTKSEANKKKTRCFRLDTEDRKKYLHNEIDLYDIFCDKSYFIDQKRFSENAEYIFDIDATNSDEKLMKKIQMNACDLNNIFSFNRGVEISKSGMVSQCSCCGRYQGVSKNQILSGNKICSFCNADMIINSKNTRNIVSDVYAKNSVAMYVGENVQRYSLKGNKYIEKKIIGVNYKNMGIYKGNKILFRKTGLGIKACIDYDEKLTSQTVYILRLIEEHEKDPLEYYLALFNSRVVYYYYLKKYGENEWKSHPYFTKKIIYSLPIKKYENDELCNEIVVLSKQLMRKYEHEKDIELEMLICKLYGLTEHEKSTMFDAINKLPDLEAINLMKVKL